MDVFDDLEKDCFTKVMGTEAKEMVMGCTVNWRQESEMGGDGTFLKTFCST